MIRPLHIWLIFGASLAVLLAAMGWVSLTVLDLDRTQYQAKSNAEQEEKTRLALWRMESILTPLIVEESARPYFYFTAFHSPEQAYTKSYKSTKDVVVPSPLLTFASSNVLLHFQWDTTRGRLASPQVPTGNERSFAQSKYTTPANIEASSSRLKELNDILHQEASDLAVTTLKENFPPVEKPLLKSLTQPFLNRDILMQTCVTTRTNVVPLSVVNVNLQQQVTVNQQAETAPLSKLKVSQVQDFNQKAQVLRNNFELNARENAAQKVSQKDPGPGNYLSPWSLNLVEGPLQPIWTGSALLLARRVNVSGQDFIQGAWLNWSNLQTELLESIRDLLPTASLEPVFNLNDKTPDKLQLATIPVRLVAPLIGPSSSLGLTPLRLSLAVAWACVLLAALAVAGLLFGVVSLSERRGAFVSAVTHELRTPLTTFKMYSEMLSEDMVPDADQRRKYLKTLCLEANRLGHLVENVLAFARLERGSARERMEKLPVKKLVNRIQERLQQRCEQAEMVLVVDCPDQAANSSLHVDVAAVEQILFNLVDNACKYGNSEDGPHQIHLETSMQGQMVLLRVRDHGPGISPESIRRLFQPFSKSAQQAAHSAPGVGLGLALCKRLSRSLGGNLVLHSQDESPGACFVLSLPMASS